VVLNFPSSTQSICPPQAHQTIFDPLPSSPIISYFLSSSSPGENLDASNEETKKKNKMKNEKNKNNQGGNQSFNVVSVDNVKKHTNIGCKPRFPCRIFKDQHLLNHFPSFPKVLKVFSTISQQPMSLATTSHANDIPSTNDHKVEGKKGKVKIPF
jgi:hypothetical protein